jgi:hypothetical protein
VYRLAYPTLVSASYDHAYLHDVPTGSLVQIININALNIFYIDVNERHVVVGEPDVVHVLSRASGTEVLRIPYDIAMRRVEPVGTISGDSFVTPLPLFPDLVDSYPPYFIAGLCIPQFARKSESGTDTIVPPILNVSVAGRPHSKTLDMSCVIRPKINILISKLSLGVFVRPRSVIFYIFARPFDSFFSIAAWAVHLYP